MRKTFESLGVMAFESASLYFGRAQEIIERGRIWGASELQDAVDQGNGVILIGVHLNSMEAAAAIMHANGFQFSCVTRKQRNPVADYIAETRRKKRYGIRNVYERKDLGLAARHLRRQRLNLWLAADQDMGRRSTVWVPFFGHARLGRFDPRSEEWKTWELPTGPAGTELPYALAVHPQTGDVWITGSNTDTLIRFHPATEQFDVFPLPTPVSWTREIEFDTRGHVWTCTSDVRIAADREGVSRFIELELPAGGAAE